MVASRHQYRSYIKATPDRVWQALIDPNFTRRYFHGTSFAEPPELGGNYRTVTSDGQPAIEGTIEEFDPPHRFVHTWRMLYDPALAAEPASRVEWTIAAVGDGLTQVDLVHGELARSPLTWASVRHGWTWILDGLKTLLETGDSLPPVTPTAAAEVQDVEGDWHRAQGVTCNNGVWEMVEADRSAANDEEMLRRAYASAYHWQRAARRGPENEARATYMLSKAWLLAGQPTLALRYADDCLARCTEAGLADFDLAYAHEARARSLAALGRSDEATAEWATARSVPIADPEDQAIVDADFADAPVN